MSKSQQDAGERYRLSQARRWEVLKQHGSLVRVEQDVMVLPNGQSTVTVYVHVPTSLLADVFDEDDA